MVLLKKITIENYKNITQLEIDLSSNISGSEKDVLFGRFALSKNKKAIIPGISMLFGMNAIGKTSIIGAVTLISDMSNGFIFETLIRNIVTNETIRIERVNLFNNNLQNISKREKVMPQEIIDGINKKTGKYWELFLVEQREFLIRLHKNIAKDLKSNIMINLEFDGEEINGETPFARLTITPEGTTNTVLPQDANLAKEISLLISTRLYSGTRNYFQSEFMAISTSRQQDALNPNTISISLAKLKNDIGEKQLVNLIKLSDPTIKKFNFLQTKNGYISAESVTDIYGKKLRLNSLSTGTLHMINLLSVIIAFKNRKSGIVLIDEIEISIHPELIASLTFLMKKMFKKYNTQFIITSHSPYATKALSYKQILTLDIAEDSLVVKKLSSFIKPHQSITKAFENGVLSSYPDEHNALNTIANLEI